MLENEWTDWEPKFKKYLSTMVVIDRTPLLYTIRENDAPDVAGVFSNFNEE